MTGHAFTSKPSQASRRRLSSVNGPRPQPPTNEQPTEAFSHVTPMWAGIAGRPTDDQAAFEVAISIHDGVYATDFASSVIQYDSGSTPEARAIKIESHILDLIRKFSSEHVCKFLGAGVTLALLKEVPIISLLQSR